MSKQGNSDSAAKATEGGFDPILVRDRLRSWFPNLSELKLEQLVTLQSEVLKFSKTINLVSVTTLKSVESQHTADCVSAFKLISPLLVPNAPLYDFGSGNGFPGLVFAALLPELPLVLVERDSRKLEFCKQAALAMNLKNVSFVGKPVEELPERSVVNAVGRGLAPLPRALLISRRVVSKGGKFFHMKGDGWANELGLVPSQLFTYWTPSLVGQYRIPDSTSEMAVFLTEKAAD